MATTVASQDDARPDVTMSDEATVAAPGREIVRDIARGGFAGGSVGVFVIGLGGRLVMRLATILHEGAVGSTTDNGNRIGAITLDGTFGLLVNGFIVGLMAGTLWVIVSPWMGRAGLARALLAVPLGIALAISGLIQDEPGRDFSLLGHDPAVVVALIVLVGLVGFSLSATDGWLDARLPHPTSDHPVASAIYPLFALLGAVIIFPIVVASYFLTGENRIYERFGQHGAQFGRNQPFSNVFFVPGAMSLGAWELKARWSCLDLDPLNRGQYNDFTAGFNWYWSDRVRCLFDWIHPITSAQTVFGPTTSDIIGMRFDFNW